MSRIISQISSLLTRQCLFPSCLKSTSYDFILTQKTLFHTGFGAGERHDEREKRLKRARQNAAEGRRMFVSRKQMSTSRGGARRCSSSDEVRGKELEEWVTASLKLNPSSSQLVEAVGGSALISLSLAIQLKPRVERRKKRAQEQTEVGWFQTLQLQAHWWLRCFLQRDKDVSHEDKWEVLTC